MKALVSQWLWTLSLEGQRHHTRASIYSDWCRVFNRCVFWLVCSLNFHLLVMHTCVCLMYLYINVEPFLCHHEILGNIINLYAILTWEGRGLYAHIVLYTFGSICMTYWGGNSTLTCHTWLCWIYLYVDPLLCHDDILGKWFYAHIVLAKQLFLNDVSTVLVVLTQWTGKYLDSSCLPTVGPVEELCCFLFWCRPCSEVLWNCSLCPSARCVALANVNPSL